MKILIATLATLLLATTIVAQNLEVKNEKENIGQRLRMAIEEGKLTPEQARERFTEWRKNVGTDVDSRHGDRMRNSSRDGRVAREHRGNRGGQRERAEGTSRRDHQRIGGDHRKSGEYRQRGEIDSKRHRTSSRQPQLQHRPDSRQHREFRREYQGTCGRCGKGTSSDRRGSRRFRSSERQGFSSRWSDRRSRGSSHRIRTFRPRG